MRQGRKQNLTADGNGSAIFMVNFTFTGNFFLTNGCPRDCYHCSFDMACSLRNESDESKYLGEAMTMQKQRGCLISQQQFEPVFANRMYTTPISLKSAEQIAIDLLLEELADVIEAEGGILIP
jgi:hypothetical protein